MSSRGNMEATQDQKNNNEWYITDNNRHLFSGNDEEQIFQDLQEQADEIFANILFLQAEMNELTDVYTQSYDPEWYITNDNYYLYYDEKTSHDHELQDSTWQTLYDIQKQADNISTEILYLQTVIDNEHKYDHSTQIDICYDYYCSNGDIVNINYGDIDSLAGDITELPVDEEDIDLFEQEIYHNALTQIGELTSENIKLKEIIILFLSRM
eukprot:310700_1